LWRGSPLFGSNYQVYSACRHHVEGIAKGNPAHPQEEDNAMLIGTFEVANVLVLAQHPLLRLPAPCRPEMKWGTTERGLEACWTVRPEEPAHFVLRKGRLVPAALAACCDE
jgi:hypothetical protein